MNNNPTDKEINKWSAKECGVDILHSENWSLLNDIKLPHYRHYSWDFRDPRCMAVIRGHFKICSNWSNIDPLKLWTSSNGTEIQMTDKFYHTSELIGAGKSPHEADCACLVNIWEASSEQ